MFNYYWQERSFYHRSIAEIEQHIIEVNNILTQADQYDHFFRYTKFDEFPYGKKSTIANLLFEQLTNEQLKRRIVPVIYKRFTSIDTSFVEISQMNKNKMFSDKHNDFMGPLFYNTNNSMCYVVGLCSYQQFRTEILKSTVNVNNLQIYSSIVSNHVILTSDAFAMLKSKGNCVKRLYEDIISLEQYICDGNWNGVFNEYDISKKTIMTISDESDTVKANPKLQNSRKFYVPSKGKVCCFLHIKEGTFRFYLYPDEDIKKVYIVHITSHLPTKKY